MHADAGPRAKVFAQFEGAVQKALASRGAPGLEIEFRIGRQGGGGFVPGVPREGFERLTAVLSQSPAFREVASSTETSYFFHQNNSKQRGRLDSGGVWTTKELVALADLDGHIRSAACYEFRSPPPENVSPATSSFCRRKQRRSWEWTVLPWRVDLTIVESNEDPDAEDCHYEVEVELDPTATYFAPLGPLLECGRSIAQDLFTLAKNETL